MLDHAVHFLEGFVNTVGGLWPAHKPEESLLRSAKVVAHRGDHFDSNCIENTMPAFQACDRHNVWGIEFDVRWTADEQPVISHDPDLSRCFGKSVPISAVPLSELLNVEPRVPTLKEVIESFGGRRHLMIEIKQPLTPTRESRLASQLNGLAPAKDFHILSLNPDWLDGHFFFPKLSRMLVAQTNTRHISDSVQRLGLGAIGGHYLLLNRKLQTRHQRAGRGVGVGFVNARSELYRCLNRRVDWIFSNRAIQVQSALDG